MKNKIANCSETRACGANARRLTPAACGALALLCLSVTFLSGCAARALRTDYRSYENSYAESSNRQMLLNLARLSEHHPTYFFKMGQITTNYRYQATVGGNGTYSPPGYPAGPGGGGTPAALYEKDPGFSFVPVNDDATAQQLLKPMPAELFYVLFQQGWRVDQLMRLMVDHIEYKPDPKSDAVHTIRNVASKSQSERLFDVSANQRTCLPFAAARTLNFFSRSKISAGTYGRADANWKRRAASERHCGCVVEESCMAAGSEQQRLLDNWDNTSRCRNSN